MKKQALLLLTTLLLGCSGAPPVQVAGKWVGWCEEAMSTKTGITLELKQNERDVTGTYHAVKVGALGEETHDGTVTGKVKGDEVALEFSDPQLDMTPAITVKLTESDGVRKLGGYIQPDASGIGTKYYFEEQKGKK